MTPAQLADEGRQYAQYVRGLWRFLSEPSDDEENRRRVARDLAGRGPAFLAHLRRAVYECPTSPYASLFEHAGLEPGDVEALVEEHDVEGALDRLHDAGVYVTIEEFKGRRPIRRGSLELHVTAEDFDVPTARLLTATSGGSGGKARPVAVTAAALADTNTYGIVFLDAFGVRGRPAAIVAPLPPALSGLMSCVILARMGVSVERWFSLTAYRTDERSLRAVSLLAAAWGVARAKGSGFGWPRYTPAENSDRIARWLAEKVATGSAAFVATTPSAAVRICTAAREHGLDVSGTLFSLGGEAYTEAKADVLASVGAEGVSSYGMSEIGWVGMPCSAPATPGECHVITPRVAVRQRARGLPGGLSVGALYLTGLASSSGKVMINVESGDTAVVGERDCGCGVQKAGLTTHLETIRSYEKLTSEGMTMFVPQLLELTESVLPGRFGGGPVDYQFAEQEDADGTTRIRLLVSPAVGDIDEPALVQSVLTHLRSEGRPETMMAEVWQGAGTLEVVRRAPEVTWGGKVLPLHFSGRAQA